jgi:hypothetical protein
MGSFPRLAGAGFDSRNSAISSLIVCIAETPKNEKTKNAVDRTPINHNKGIGKVWGGQ